MRSIELLKPLGWKLVVSRIKNRKSASSRDFFSSLKRQFKCNYCWQWTTRFISYLFSPPSLMKHQRTSFFSGRGEGVSPVRGCQVGESWSTVGAMRTRDLQVQRIWLYPLDHCQSMGVITQVSSQPEVEPGHSMWQAEIFTGLQESSKSQAVKLSHLDSLTPDSISKHDPLRRHYQRILAQGGNDPYNIQGDMFSQDWSNN